MQRSSLSVVIHVRTLYHNNDCSFLYKWDACHLSDWPSYSVNQILSAFIPQDTEIVQACTKACALPSPLFEPLTPQQCAHSVRSRCALWGNWHWEIVGTCRLARLGRSGTRLRSCGMCEYQFHSEGNGSVFEWLKYKNKGYRKNRQGLVMLCSLASSFFLSTALWDPLIKCL